MILNCLLESRANRVCCCRLGESELSHEESARRRRRESKLSTKATKVVAKAVKGKKKVVAKAVKGKKKKWERSSLTNLIQSNGTIDLRHCKSEGGKQQCAECDGHGSLCQQVYRASSDVYCNSSRWQGVKITNHSRAGTRAPPLGRTSCQKGECLFFGQPRRQKASHLLRQALVMQNVIVGHF